jgi:hypothetical protein
MGHEETLLPLGIKSCIEISVCQGGPTDIPKCQREALGNGDAARPWSGLPDFAFVL